MDLASILRTLGGLATVLGMLSAALWLVRRYDIRLPGRTGMTRASRLELVERLPIDARRSVALLRRDGREHLILIAPEGHVILESAVVRDAADFAAVPPVAEAAPEVPQFRAELAAVGQGFGTLVERARDRAVPLGEWLAQALVQAVKLATRHGRRISKGIVARVQVLRRVNLLRSIGARAREGLAEAGRTLDERIARLVATMRPMPLQAAASAPVAASRDPFTPPKRRAPVTAAPPLLRLMIDRPAAAMAGTYSASDDPPPPPRASVQRTATRPPSRKPARKARAARKGVRHG